MRTHARLATALLVSLVLLSGTLAMTSPAQSATWAPRVTRSFDPQTDLEQFEARILVRINRARARRGMGEVRVFHSCVDSYSERWSARIMKAEELEHRNLRTVLDGCNLSWVGETLVAGTGLRPAKAVRAWLDSPSHRAVILKRRARWAGIGVRVSESGRVYAALNFGDRG